MELLSSTSMYLLLIVFVVISLLRGLKKGLARAIVNLIVTVSSTVVAFLMVKTISPLFTGLVKDLLGKLEDTEDLIQLMNSSEAVEKFIGILGNALLLPFVFFIVFVVLYTVFGIVAAIVSAPIIKKVKAKKKIAGLAVGIANGLLFFIILMIPTLCYASFFDTLTEKAPSLKAEIVEAVGEENMEMIEENILQPIQNNVVYVALEDNVVHASMHILTSVSFSGSTMDVYDAVNDIGGVIEAAMPLTEGEVDVKNLTPEQLDCIDNMIDAIGDSPLLSSFIADIVSAFSGAWAEGDAFLTVEFPIPEDETGAMSGIYQSILLIFADSDGNTIVTDFHTISAIARILYDRGLVALATNQSELIASISDNNTLNSMVDILCENDHFRPLIPEVMNLGIWALTQKLGIPSDVNEAYSNLMGDIASALESEDLDIESVSQEISTLMDEYGAEDIPEEFTSYLAEALIEMKESSDMPLTEEDLTKFFEDFGSLYEESMQQTSKGGLANLAARENVYGNILEKLLENVKNIEGGEALMVSFASPETAPIAIITAVDLMPSVENFLNLSTEEMKQEISTITEVIDLSVEVVKSMQGASGDALDMIESLNIEALGQALEKMGGTVLLGDKTGDLLEAVLSSSTIKDAGVVGQETIQAMRDSLESGEGNLTNALTSMQQTVSLIGALGSDDTDDDKVEEKITWLVENMSPSSANILQSMISPKMLSKYKLSGESAEKVSSVMGVLLAKMADTNAMTTEEYKQEAEAIKYFYHVAIDASKGTGNTIFGGRVPEAEVLLDRMMSSKVLTATFNEVVYGKDGNEYNVDPLGISKKISAKDREAWGNEIQKYQDENPGADYRTIKALGLIFGYEMN